VLAAVWLGPAGFLEGVKAKREKLFGFGHRVYKNFDPRAKIIRGVSALQRGHLWRGGWRAQGRGVGEGEQSIALFCLQPGVYLGPETLLQGGGSWQDPELCQQGTCQQGTIQKKG